MTNSQNKSSDKDMSLPHRNSHSNKNSIHPFRRLVIFQLKLAVDALRDVILSPVSIVCSLIDLVEKRKGKARQG